MTLFLEATHAGARHVGPKAGSRTANLGARTVTPAAPLCREGTALAGLRRPRANLKEAIRARINSRSVAEGTNGVPSPAGKRPRTTAMSVFTNVITDVVKNARAL